MDALDVARWQFGIVTIYHFLLVLLTIGLAPIVAIMGGVDDKRLVSRPSVIEEATAASAAPPRLVVSGFVMMGGVTIRS